MKRNEKPQCLRQRNGTKARTHQAWHPAVVLAALSCLAAVVLLSATAVHADEASLSAGAKPDLRSELLKNGPIPWIGTFGSPGAARTNLLKVGSIVAAATKAKAKAMIIMAKGEPGFCVWDSKNYDYALGGVSTTDYLGEFVAACEAQGIIPGVFYSIGDAHYEGAARYNGPLGVPYFNLIKQQVAELLTRYRGFRFIVLLGAARFSETQWTELRQVISRLSPNGCVLCEPSARIAEEPGVLAFQWTKGTAALQWKEGTSAQSVYQSCAAQIAGGRASVMMIWPDQETGSMSQQQVAVLKQTREMLDRNPPTTRASVPANTKTPTERLKQLQEALDGGFITKEVFDQKKQEIINSM